MILLVFTSLFYSKSNFKTGFYEKITHRKAILTVLKHLWELPSHREAFRGIAAVKRRNGSGSIASSSGMQIAAPSSPDADTGADAADSDYFIRFANGLMNETNSLVSGTLEKLQEIKLLQTKIQSPEQWAALSEEDRTQVRDRLRENEGQVKGLAGLCHETLHFVNLLTSDAVIKIPFLMGEILPRFAGTSLLQLNFLPAVVWLSGYISST